MPFALFQIYVFSTNLCKNNFERMRTRIKEDFPQILTAVQKLQAERSDTAEAYPKQYYKNT